MSMPTYPATPDEAARVLFAERRRAFGESALEPLAEMPPDVQAAYRRFGAGVADRLGLATLAAERDTARAQLAAFVPPGALAAGEVPALCGTCRELSCVPGLPGCARCTATEVERVRAELTDARADLRAANAECEQWRHTFGETALRDGLTRIARAEDERDEAREQVKRVEALRDRWEATVRDPAIYRNGGVEHAAALAASHLPDLRAALGGTEPGTPPADLDAEEIDLTTAVCDVLSDIEDGTLTADGGIAALREFLAGRQDDEDDGDDGPDMANPTPALRQAVTDALFADSNCTPEQEALLDAYFAVTCGDCETGRCHWGGQASADSIAAAEAGREYHQRCGCDRHEVSVRWRAPAGQESAP